MESWMYPATAVPALEAFLRQQGFVFSERPHQFFMAKNGRLTLNMYRSGKLVFNTTDCVYYTALLVFLADIDGASPSDSRRLKKTEPLPDDLYDTEATRIGTDEAGKGDYFGPLVVGGVLLDRFTAEILADEGIADSKTLSDRKIMEKAKLIRRRVPPAQRKVLVLAPATYNRMHAAMKNVNAMMGWAHAAVIEDLLTQTPDCSLAVVDKFGNERYIRDALKERGKGIQLVQITKGEREIAVAAASILARERFVFEMDALSKRFGLTVPKGATAVIPTARQLVRVHGEEVLTEAAKRHFVTTFKVLAKS